MSDIEQKYQIGFTWDVYDWCQQKVYQKKILDAKEKDNILYYLVADNQFKEDFSGFGSVYPADNLEQVIKVDGENLEFDLKAAKEREIQKQKEEERKKIEEDTNGFADQFSPMQRAKIISTLNKLKRVDERIMTRKDFVRARVLEGFYTEVKTFCNQYGRKINGERTGGKEKDEYTLVAKYCNSFYVVTKTEYEYTKYLIEIGYKEQKQ
jgi:hypothetical protein